MRTPHEDATLLSYYAKAYGVPKFDLQLMALNLFGIRTAVGGGRARFELRLYNDQETEWHFIVPTGRAASPFHLDGVTLSLLEAPIGTLRLIEHDDARLGYLPDNGRVLTINTNNRSTCTGCVFCPNTLADANDPQLSESLEIREWIKAFFQEHNLTDISAVNQVNVSTGCFGEESKALDHLNQLNAHLRALGFSGRLGFLTSVIRTDDGLRSLRDLRPFCLFLTVECLGRRSLLLKDSKASLTPDAAIDLLARARGHGLDTGVMLVVGLDQISEVAAWLGSALPYLTDFPNLQLFQAHNPFMDLFRVEGAGELEFFVRARKEFEREILKTDLRPRRWQNYRPLWHYSFGTEGLPL
jgi:hypothetical protein